MIFRGQVHADDLGIPFQVVRNTIEADSRSTHSALAHTIFGLVPHRVVPARMRCGVAAEDGEQLRVADGGEIGVGE